MASNECDTNANALPQSLEKLNIISDSDNNGKFLAPVATNNPFDLSNIVTAPNINEQLFGPTCHHIDNNSSHKKEHNLHQIRTNKQKANKNNYRKLFRDPILHYLNGKYSGYARQEDELGGPTTNINFPLPDTELENANKNRIDFKTLVNDCANLTLSTGIDCKLDSFRIMQQRSTAKRDRGSMPSSAYRFHQSPNNISTTMLPLSASSSSSTVDVENNNNATTSCSQQALLTYSPCDVTCDELASYFETFVHIPKKMSTMADAMYI